MSKLLANEIANYGDNAPIDIKEGLNIPAGKPLQADGISGLSGQVLSSTGNSIAWVATFDGDYNSLTNKPTIPSAQVSADWNATSGVAVILNKPTVPPLSSVTTNTAGTAALSYNSTNGEFTFTPPDLSGYQTTTASSLALGNGSSTFTILFSQSTGSSPRIVNSVFSDTGLEIQGAYNFGSTYAEDIFLGTSGTSSRFKNLNPQADLSYNLGSSTKKWDNVYAGKLYYSNVFDELIDLPSASTYHGMFAHVHATGKGYYAHGGAWISLANESQIANASNWDTAYGWGNHATQGYLTSYTETQDLDAVLLLGATTARDITTTGKILYSNNYANLGDLPSASTYHGMFAHVHAEGHGYYAHAGGWVQLLDTESSIAELGDVDLSAAPQVGQVLKYDGSNWVAGPDNSGSGGAGIALTDISVTTATAGTPSLSYNSTSGAFTYTPPDLSGYASNTNVSNWDTAYGWGDHSTEGYLTTETDPVFSASAASGISSSNIANWDSAYGWGDHSTAGYLTSYTETDPVFSASAAVGITSTNITNWDAAYGWGDHTNAGYLTSLPAHGITNHTDVVISTAQNDQLLKYNSTSGKWENWTSNYLTETNEIVQGNSKAEVIGSGTSDGEFKVTLQDATNSGAGEISLRQSTSGSYNITELNEGNKAANSKLVLNHLTTTNAWSEIHFKRTGASSGTSIIRSGGGNSFEFFPVDGNVEFSISGTGTYTRLNHIVQGSLTAGGLSYPTTNGSSGDVLTSDGAGNVTWQTPTGGGGGGIALTDLSVTSNSAGSPALSYNNSTGVFTYTPPDLSSFLTSETDTLDSVTGRGNTTTNSISVGGLAVDTDVLFVDASQNQVGIGTNNPDTQLSIYDASSAAYMSIKSGTPNIPYWIGAYGGSNGGFFIERGDNNNNILTVDQSDNVFLYGAGALRLETTSIGVTVSGSATATSFIKTGGTSSQYLMADGSVTTSAGGGGANVTISDTIPAGTPTAGDLWWESDSGRLKIYYQDVDSSQWIDANPPLAPALSSNAPATASSTGSAGDIRYDSGYVYICVATNTWKRASLTTW